MRAENIFVSGIPVSKNILNKFNEQTIALNVRLLPEKVHQFVVTGGKLVNPGGNLSQLPFSADFAEVDGENSEKLFYQIVRRAISVLSSAEISF